MGNPDKQVALVTGGGQGIGRGIALRLAQDGYHVIVNVRRPPDPEGKTGAIEVQRTIAAAGGTAEVFRADIASEEERAALVRFIVDHCGRLDLLVNNAGVAPEVRRDILEATIESFDRVLGINLRGPYFLTQALARHMVAWKQQGITPSPRIAFITSISSYTSSPARGEYCVSKAGLSMAARLFAHRLAEFGIPVIEIAPGIIETPMTAGVKAKYDRLIADGLLLTPRWGQPDDVARAVAAFAQGQLDYSTGSQIEVGGGFGVLRL